MSGQEIVAVVVTVLAVVSTVGLILKRKGILH